MNELRRNDVKLRHPSSAKLLKKQLKQISKEAKSR